MKKIKRKSMSRLKLELKSAISKYVRTRDTVDGRGPCISCGVWKTYEELQAGHFINIYKHATAYDPRNINAQCFRCNINLKGNWPGYYAGMQRKYGQAVIDELLKKSEEIKQWKRFEIEALIQTYRMNCGSKSLLLPTLSTLH